MRRGKPPPPALDHSSLSQQTLHGEDREAARRRSLHEYNESTFGEREPWVLWPFFVILPAVACACFWLHLPRSATRLSVLGAFAICWYWSRLTTAIRERIDRHRAQ